MQVSPHSNSNANELNKLEKRKKEEEIRKLTLEQEKIKLENAELRKHWFKKPVWWGIISPIIVASVSLFILFANGYFNATFAELRASKILLTIDTDSLNRRKDKLNLQIDSLRNIFDSSRAVNDSLKIEIEKQVNDNNSLKRNFDKIRKDYVQVLIDNKGKITKEQAQALVGKSVQEIIDRNRETVFYATEGVGEYRRQLANEKADRIHFQNESVRLQDSVVGLQILVDGLKRELRNCKAGLKN